jgi:hypothetical protein
MRNAAALASRKQYAVHCASLDQFNYTDFRRPCIQPICMFNMHLGFWLKSRFQHRWQFIEGPVFNLALAVHSFRDDQNRIDGSQRDFQTDF